MTQEQHPVFVFEGKREGQAGALEPVFLLTYETP